MAELGRTIDKVTSPQSPSLSDDQAKRLSDQFCRLDYTVDAVLDRLGEVGQLGLARNSTMPAREVLADADDPQADLIRLFVLQQATPVKRADRLPINELRAAGLVIETDQQLRATIDIRPYGFEIASTTEDGSFAGWIVSDHQPDLDFRPRPTRPDYVLGVSPASTTLAQLTPTRPVERALDLGTGCGVQSLHLSAHAEQIVATDLNPRALALAKLTMQLNGIDAELRLGDLYQPVNDEKFDLIVTNPPFVIAPPSADEDRLLYREGALPGDQLVEKVVRQGARKLRPGGTLHVLANWANDATDWQTRLSDWAVTDGFNLWAIEREQLDPFAYIEMWLADAGLAGTDQWEPRYRQWLQYFERLGIQGVSMGWITVSPAEGPLDIETESWPHQVAQPVGDVLAGRAQRAALSRVSDDQLFATHWQIADGVVQETMGQPGAADPEYVVLRQSLGLKRAMQVDTALAAILGACDGELPLAVIVEAVGQLLGEPVDRASVAASIRQAILDDYLQPAN